MEKIIVYEKPTCTTCKKTVALLEEKGVEFDKINYYIEPLTKSKIEELLALTGIPAKDLLRSRAKEYKEFDLKNGVKSDSEIIDLMVQYPDLVQRPIVVKGKKAVLARPIEKINELFE
ncbi:MAG: arsenate reductase (glutaredoxin) [Melioribacteraceae bacterium]|nr:MAG: arsenate reductase (glutaredoxin) [Melioribacteraceae bacterium]